MNKQYLINQVELFCREYDLDPADVYETLGILYQSVNGYNIVKQMHDKHLIDMPQFLEDKGQGFIEKYIECLNMLRNNISGKKNNIIYKEYISIYADKYAAKKIEKEFSKKASLEPII